MARITVFSNAHPDVTHCAPGWYAQIEMAQDHTHCLGPEESPCLAYAAALQWFNDYGEHTETV